ncbi:hypothetical protein [Dokdonia sp.]|uniref:hypothetical protein n=1 Tax=Dokdonia sp. TaxID=2024995 RepID=UPI0032647684
MQTRDYDDYIFVPSLNGFRSVDINNRIVDVSQETNGYCNIYANHISLSFLHSMDALQINAIHYFEDHQKIIFNVIVNHLKEIYAQPKKELGFIYINILPKSKEDTCLTEYVFLNTKNQKIRVKMYKDVFINITTNEKEFFKNIRKWVSGIKNK